MRIRLHTLVGAASPFLAALLGGFGMLGCSSPTGTDAPVVTFTEASYRFACRAWTPGPPPATRTLLDLRLSQIDTASEPAAQLVDAIEAVGGRVIYRFNGPQVRVELDVAAVPRLAWLNSAVTVAEPDTHDVTLIVMLTHDLTVTDLQAVAALGGRVTREFHALEGYVVIIDDARVPEVRALPGVALAGFDAIGCLA